MFCRGKLNTRFHFWSSKPKLIRSKIWINNIVSSAPFWGKYYKFLHLVCKLTSLHKLLTSVDWCSILMEYASSFLTKILFSILPMPYTYDSSLIKEKRAVRVCLCSSQYCSNTCWRSCMNIQEQSCLKVFQQCRRKKEKKCIWLSNDKDSNKKKKKKTVSDRVGRENYRERELLVSPVNRKVRKLLVAIPSARVYLSPP